VTGVQTCALPICYIIREASSAPRAIVIATGSEVSIAIDAAKQLDADGIPTRVVSLPSWELFAAQDESWRNRVLPPSITARVSIEAGTTFGWERFGGCSGRMIEVGRA